MGTTRTGTVKGRKGFGEGNVADVLAEVGRMDVRTR